MSEQLYTESISGLKNLKICSLIGLTTPRTMEGNWVNILADLTDESGLPMFDVIRMSTICDICAQLPSISERIKCTHCWVPPHKSKLKQLRNTLISDALGCGRTTAQEDCGVVFEGEDGKLFDFQQIDENFNISENEKTSRLFLDKNFIPERIFVFSDPNADGPSDTTCFSCFWAPPHPDGGLKRLVVCGLDAHKTKNQSQKEQLVLRHLERLRYNPKYSKVPIIFVPENMTGSYASHMEGVVRNIDSVVTLHEGGPNKKPGVFKGRKTTENYLSATQQVLDNSQLYWDGDLFTLSNEFIAEARKKERKGSQKSSIEIMIACVKQQMKQMKVVDGKITGKVSNILQDDLAITMMMMIYWSIVVEDKRSKVYEYYRNLKFLSGNAASMNVDRNFTNKRSMENVDFDDGQKIRKRPRLL